MIYCCSRDFQDLRTKYKLCFSEQIKMESLFKSMQRGRIVCKSLLIQLCNNCWAYELAKMLMRQERAAWINLRQVLI